MHSGTFLDLVAILYYLCGLLLAGLVCFVACRHAPRSRVMARRAFLALACCLFLWQLTLFLEVRIASPIAALLLGRANFAAVAMAACFALRFVQAMPPAAHKTGWPWSGLLLTETTLVAVVTLVTPLIDEAERVVEGQAVSLYGPLFPVYLLHVLGFLASALLLAFRKRRQTRASTERGPLALMGLGMLATGGLAFVTNAFLPYVFGDFRFCDAGTLGTLFFVLATAYATFVQGLFDRKTIVRETLVYGVLLAFVLGAYSSTILLATQYLTSSTGPLTQFVVLFLAFSIDPLRRYLEKRTDRLLADRHSRRRHGPGGDGPRVRRG